MCFDAVFSNDAYMQWFRWPTGANQELTFRYFLQNVKIRTQVYQISRENNVKLEYYWKYNNRQYNCGILSFAQRQKCLKIITVFDFDVNFEQFTSCGHYESSGGTKIITLIMHRTLKAVFSLLEKIRVPILLGNLPLSQSIESTHVLSETIIKKFSNHELSSLSFGIISHFSN